MAARPLVYVHGAGPKKGPTQLKQDLDQALFGEVVAFSRIAYYADVRWPPAPAGVGPALAAEGPSRASRQRAINRSAQPGVSAKEAAATVVAAASGARAGGAGQPGLSIAADAPRARPSAEAVGLVEQLYRRADRVAARSGAPPPSGARDTVGPMAFGISFPDPIFRLVVGSFASDVIDYLYGPWAERMRAPVRAAILATPQPGVIVAHSLGTIIAYDVLAEPAFSGLDIELFVTAGSPLGIGNVQDQLRDDVGRPNPVPGEFGAWTNFADSWDPVALDPTLRGEFQPPVFITDIRVNNPAPNNHEFTGYLGVSVVRSTVIAAVGQ